MVFPGMTNQLPAVYGPMKYPVKKIGEDNYYIKGYSNYEFKGSIKKIASEILTQLVHHPEEAPRLHYVGPFSLNFNPEMNCCLCMDPDLEPSDLDWRIITDGLTKELQPFITIAVDGSTIIPHITLPDGTGPFIIGSIETTLDQNVQRDGIDVFYTDYSGLDIRVVGDMHVAAIALLDYSIKHLKNYGYMFGNKDKTDFTHRIGAFDFKIVDRKIVDVEPHFKVPIPHFAHAPEDRLEVFELIKLMKSTLKMKMFW